MGIQIDLKRGDFEAMHPTTKTFNFDAVKMTYIGNCDDVKRLNELWSTWCACVGMIHLEASVPTLTKKMICAIEATVENQLEASGIEEDPYRLDGEKIWNAAIEAGKRLEVGDAN